MYYIKLMARKILKSRKTKKGGGLLAESVLNKIITVKLPLRTILSTTKSIYMSGKNGNPFSFALIKTLL
jgi:hypothetical protein